MRTSQYMLVQLIKNKVAFLEPEDLSLSGDFKIRYNGAGETPASCQVAIFDPRLKSWDNYEIRVTRKR